MIKFLKEDIILHAKKLGNDYALNERNKVVINMIRIFSKDRKELHSDVDTWIVKWTTYKHGYSIKYPEIEECYKAFTDKNEADEYANALNDAMKLIGITSLPKAKVYKQEVNSI